MAIPRGDYPDFPDRDQQEPLPPPPVDGDDLASIPTQTDAPEALPGGPIVAPGSQPFPPTTGEVGGDQDTDILPPDLIGDIPPPPVPAPPAISGTGLAGIPGTEGSTFARPGTPGAIPFRTPAFFSQRPPRFGPGVPIAGGGSAAVSGLGSEGGIGLSPEEAAELLRSLVAGRA
jgi:hypothetical protein